MNNLQFDFIIDESTNSVLVTKEFRADISKVWNAFTKQEILDQWWAPKPWTAKTKSMNFIVGGLRHYAMVSPEGEEHWSIEKFTAITPKTDLAWESLFADKDENINTEMPSSVWDLHFNEENETTRVSIVIKHKTLADLEMHIKMGFKEGFTMTLNELDTLLSSK